MHSFTLVCLLHIRLLPVVPILLGLLIEGTKGLVKLIHLDLVPLSTLIHYPP